MRTWDSIGGLGGVLTLMEDFIDMVIAHKHSADLQKTLRETYQIKRDQVRSGAASTMKKGGPGLFVGYSCPAWLTPLHEPIVIDGHEFMYDIIESVATMVRMIFGWADSGIGSVVIARRLNEAEPPIPPLGNLHRKNPAKMVKGWSPAMVVALLRNIAVIGLWQPHVVIRETVDDDGNTHKLRYAARIKDGDPLLYYPPIIDHGQFRRVGQALDKRRSNDAVAEGGRRGKGFGNIITRLCRCAFYGGKVNKWSDSKKARKTTQYRNTSNARMPGATCC